MKSISGLSFRYMKQNMQRTLMTILGVALSALLIYSIFSCSISIFENTKRSKYVSNLGWDALFIVDGDTACRLLSHVEYYNEHPQSINNITDTEHDNVPAMSAGWIMCESDSSYALYVNDFNAMPERFKLRKGTFPRSSNGVIISSNESKMNKLNVGYTVTHNVLNYNETTGETARTDAEFTVCGIYDDDINMMNYAEQTYPIDASAFKGEMEQITVMSEDMYDRDGVTVYVSYADKHSITDQTKQIADIYGIDKNSYMVTDIALECFHKENNRETTDYDMFVVIILVFGGIASLAVIFIVRNAFNISVHERSSDYGILRCIGLTRRQIIHIIINEAFTVGICGTIIGIIIGHSICAFAFKVISRSFDYLGGYHITMDGILWTLFCMLIVTCYAMIAPIEKLYKLNPIDALKHVDEIQAVEKKLSGSKRKKSEKEIAKEQRKNEKLVIKRAKRADKISRSFGVELGYAYKNILRTKGAFVRTIVTLTIGGSLFVGGSIAMKGMEGWMFNEANMDKCSGYFVCADENEYKTIKNELAGLDCVKDTYLSAMCAFGWNIKSDYGYEDRAFFIGLESKYFDELLGKGEKRNDRKSGDVINVICVKNVDSDIEGEEYTTLEAVRANPEINALAVVDDGVYSDYINEIDPNLAFEVTDGRASYIYEIGDGFEKYQQDIKEDVNMFNELTYGIKLNKKSHDYYKFDNYVQNTMHFYIDFSVGLDLILGIIKIIKLIIEFVIGLILIIFFINSINQQTAQMMIRRDELKTLAVIGMSRKQRKKMLIAETMVGVVIALILSLVLGYILGNWLNIGFYRLDYIGEENLILPKYETDVLSMVIVSVLLLGLGYLTSLIGSRETE